MQIASALDSRWPEVVGAISEAIDLEATARSSGALTRRREIRTAEQLLRLALAYGPGGLSLRSAAARAGIAEGGEGSRPLRHGGHEAHPQRVWLAGRDRRRAGEPCRYPAAPA